jgi:hypothetical protein
VIPTSVSAALRDCLAAAPQLHFQFFYQSVGFYCTPPFSCIFTPRCYDDENLLSLPKIWLS